LELINMRAFLIEGGVVVQKAAPGRSAEQMGASWVDGPDDVVCGFSYADGFFVPPRIDIYPDLASARVVMLGFINYLTKKITDQYPAAEVSAWPSKAEAARAVTAGTARADQTAMIQAEADLTGAALADQAAAIVAKAEVFEAIVARVSGLRQVTDAWLVEATTSAEREAVLDDAQAQAATLADAAYGLG
jgi:hypothetical protein